MIVSLRFFVPLWLGVLLMPSVVWAACGALDEDLASLPIFNAAAFVPKEDPMGALDDASFEGLGHVALFPQSRAVSPEHTRAAGQG